MYVCIPGLVGVGVEVIIIHFRLKVCMPIKIAGRLTTGKTKQKIQLLILQDRQRAESQSAQVHKVQSGIEMRITHFNCSIC